MERARKIKWKKVIIFIILILLIIFIPIILLNKKEPEKVKKGEPKKVKKELKKEKTTKLSLVMVGDALLHSSVYNDAYKNGKYDFTEDLSLIKPIVKNYDLAFYNQETVLGGTSIGLSDYPAFNSPQEFGDAMIDAGFNIVNLATNHTMDRGEKAILNSNAYWKTKDVYTAGSYSSKEEAEQIPIKEKNGIKYAMLSYTYGTNGIAVPQGKEYLVNLYSDEKAENDINKIRDKVDLLLVSMHWGVEYRTEPTDEQKREAKYLADLGADIIIGTHPHIIEPVQYIDDTLVIYSLGNFISAQSTNGDYNTMTELMTSVDVNKKGNNKITLSNLNNRLLYNYYQSNGRKWYNFKVIPFSQMNETYNKDYKRIYEKYSNVVKMYDQNIPVEAIS